MPVNESYFNLFSVHWSYAPIQQICHTPAQGGSRQVDRPRYVVRSRSIIRGVEAYPKIRSVGIYLQGGEHGSLTNLTPPTPPMTLRSLENASTAQYEASRCSYFDKGICRSCDLLQIESGSRLASKARAVAQTTASSLAPLVALPDPWESRFKVKMAVSGTVEDPTIGIIRKVLTAADLCDCPLTPQPIRHLLAHLRSLITAQKLTPYNITERSGELKHIIVMANTTMTGGILRFVLRSSEAIPRIRKAIPSLQALFPWVTVVSCNIQPLPAAILEGEEEILLTENSYMRELFGDVPLYFAPQSFMQVTPHIAAQLYAAVKKYVTQNRCTSVLDLFCGVGGFSLHVAPHVDAVLGVELSEAAIQSAQKSAREASITNTRFVASDVEEFLAAHEPSGMSNLKPDLVIANPPRRGLSTSICDHLLKLAPRVILYSSCNPESFARDVQMLAGGFRLHHLQPFDMFPMTSHCEVLGELRRIEPS